MRRRFCLHTAVFVTLLSTVAAAIATANAAEADPPRPNILWLTCEDIGPHLGCYGDRYAATPNLDRLAAKGVVYLHAWSNAPVCAPARTTIISGVYPPSTGSQHMRSLTRLPEHMKMFPQLLRQAGYYCTNNVKEDYNLVKPGKVWDESSRKAHWKNRRAGQAFFAVFNSTVTHESRIRSRPHRLVHDPAGVRVPAYHPDAPEVRHDWAQYYDNITTMDAWIGQRLKEVQQAGLAEDTIVFFYGDHGSGMPRSKRWPYNSGLHVPLIAYVPPMFRHLAPKDFAPGGKTDRLVSFVDLAPTVLGLAGVKPPDYMQGHAFLGRYQAPPQPFVYGFRGRMDERYDMIRSVRDQRYVYVRNYMPHLVYGQHVAYMFVTPTTQVWKRLFDQGGLTAEQAHFWQTKPPEELYDLADDPDEVRNLADSPAHQETLERMRQAQRDLAVQIRDLGFLPEPEIHSRSQSSTPYAIGHNDRTYPLRRIMATAELASSLQPDVLDKLQDALQDDDSAVRYWATMGILMRGQGAVEATRTRLHEALTDKSPSVRIAAAGALGQYGNQDDLDRALPVLLELASCQKHNAYLALMALNAIDALDTKAADHVETLKALPTRVAPAERRLDSKPSRLIEKILADLEP